MRTVRRLLERALLLGVAIGVALAIGELLVRVVLPEPPYAVVVSRGLPEQPRHAPAADVHPALTLYYGTRAGRRLRVNADVVVDEHPLSHKRVAIRTNSLGYRNRELGPKAGTRVLFLGDSLTVQDYLPEEETLVRLVEDLARQRGLELETVNAGVGAVGLASELALLYETGLHVAPDVVVINFFLNDFRESGGVSVPALPAVLARSWLIRHLAVAAALYGGAGLRTPVGHDAASAAALPTWLEDFRTSHRPAAGDYRTDRRAFDLLIVQRFGDWGGAWSRGAWDAMVPLFEEFARLAKLHGFRLAVVAFPVRQQVEAQYVYDYPQRRLRGVARRLDIALLDLLPVLRGAGADAAASLFYDHCHHTPAGNRLLAAAVLDFLVWLRSPKDRAEVRGG